MRVPPFARMSARRSGRRLALRPDADDAEVRRAAADIGHQHDLLALDGLLVVIGGGDRLVFERHLAKAGAPRDILQHRLGPSIRLVVAVDEADRAAVHDGVDLLAEEAFGALLQLADEDAHDVPERDAPAAERRGLVDQRRGEDRLQRPHQPAVMLVDVGLDRLAAEEDPPMRLEIEEDRRGDQRRLALDGRKHRRAVPQHAERRVRRAEIKSAGESGERIRRR